MTPTKADTETDKEWFLMSKYKPWYALMLTGHDDSTYTDFEGPAGRCNERLDQLRDSRIWDQIKSHDIVHIA